MVSNFPKLRGLLKVDKVLHLQSKCELKVLDIMYLWSEKVKGSMVNPKKHWKTLKQLGLPEKKGYLALVSV